MSETANSKLSSSRTSGIGHRPAGIGDRFLAWLLQPSHSSPGGLMRFLTVSLALVMATTACAGRKVEVRTGPTPAADVSVRFTNNLSQAVNVYITTGGT